MNDSKLEKYKLASKICKIVFNKLKDEILKNNKTDILELTKLGDQLLIEEYEKRKIKNVKVVKIGFPTCISLNNCVGYYVYEKQMSFFNNIKENDLVKIELGLNLDDCTNIFGDTFYNKNDNDNDKLESKITKLMVCESTNDDIKRLIEAYCTEYNCFPVENTFSYQHTDFHIQSDESKYIVTNHRKYYDEDDNLAVSPDICFDLEENEVYTINLTIIPNTLDEKDHIYSELHQPHIYKYNEYFHNFRLQSSKQFYSHIKKIHGSNPFTMTNYNNNPKYKMGLKESLDNGILNYYPVLYNKQKLPVFFRKFTLIVKKENSINLNFE